MDEKWQDVSNMGASKAAELEAKTAEMEALNKDQLSQIENLKIDLEKMRKEKDEMHGSYTELSRKLAESLARAKQVEGENNILKAQLASMD